MANYIVIHQQVKVVCQWLNELRVPDGYSSKVARCATIKTGKLHGMKSHDCLVFQCVGTDHIP